ATEVIMAAVTRQLEEIRGEKAPETPYDPRRERLEQRRRTEAQTQGHTPPRTRARAQTQGTQAEGQGT
ncbi:1-acyl-sn-glycerol-3-phosphate acyltransferase, partial [Streptomyces sp. TRM76130]|nr:1-acyl-sn-glycerol-3-phosphate acyltransferase [Streptomyces sp. TRM76130]